MEETGWTIQELKYKDLITLMTLIQLSPHQMLNLVSIYMAAEKNVVKFVELPSLGAVKFSSTSEYLGNTYFC